MLAKTPLVNLAADWAARMPAEGRYDWMNCYGCACAQLAKVLGREEEWNGRVKGDEWYMLNDIARGPSDFNGMADPREHTFGKFHQRLLEYV